MIIVYGLTPTLEHYICLIELFSSSGQFDKAILVVEKVPPSDRLELWLGILGAWCKWVNLEVGRWVFDQARKLDEKCVTSYICMGNMYATADNPMQAISTINLVE